MKTLTLDRKLRLCSVCREFVAVALFSAVSSLGLVIALRRRFGYTWPYRSGKGRCSMENTVNLCAQVPVSLMTKIRE